MYDLTNFIPYPTNEHKVTNGSHRCLVWSKASGYYFVEFGFIVGDVKLIAIEN